MIKPHWVDALRQQLFDHNENPMVANWIFQYYEQIYTDETLFNNCQIAVNRYLAGEPLARILKSTHFFYQDFLVDDGVFCPRLETEILVEEVLKHCQNKNNLHILDMCCGTGVIGLSLKSQLEEKAQVTCVDINPLAVNNTIKNADRLNCKINVIESNLFSNLNTNTLYNVLVCNPPYIAYDETIADSVVKYDPDNALFANDNGLAIYAQIISQMENYLSNQYLAAFEIGASQAQAVTDLLRKQNPFLTIEIIQDYNKNNRIVIAKKDF